MAYEITQELKDKLKIIEIETDFFSRKPKKPAMSRYLVWMMTVLMVAGAWYGAKSGNDILLIFSVAYGVILFLGHQHEKQLFKLYCNACEIINHYKKVDKLKT